MPMIRERIYIYIYIYVCYLFQILKIFYCFYHKVGFDLSLYISSKKCSGEKYRRVLLYPCSLLTKQYITKSCET